MSREAQWVLNNELPKDAACLFCGATLTRENVQMVRSDESHPKGQHAGHPLASVNYSMCCTDCKCAPTGEAQSLGVQRSGEGR